MPLRPLYRWKSFWIGVLVLGFLGWDWVWSMSWEYYLSWGTSAMGAFVLSSRTGEIYLGWLGHTPEPSFMLGLTSESFEIPSGEIPWFPLFANLNSSSALSAGLTVAHWLLTLLFLLPWTAFLAWRWRRMRRAS
jgi:hypothetical protein